MHYRYIISLPLILNHADCFKDYGTHSSHKQYDLFMQKDIYNIPSPNVHDVLLMI